MLHQGDGMLLIKHSKYRGSLKEVNCLRRNKFPLLGGLSPFANMFPVPLTIPKIFISNTYKMKVIVTLHDSKSCQLVLRLFSYIVTIYKTLYKYMSSYNGIIAIIIIWDYARIEVWMIFVTFNNNKYMSSYI